MASVAYGSLPFKQQIAFFRNKQDVLTESWVDVWESEHDNAFMVAGANRAELVADFRDAMRRMQEDGETLEQFRTRFDDIVARHGWDYNGGRNWRSRVIYETNLRQSYNAGSYAQQMGMRRATPYLRYKHSDAVQHPRPVHLGWNNKIWRADNPIWKVIYPANGWGCQCYTEALSQRDIERLGKHGEDPTPKLSWIDVLVGKRSPGGPRLVRTVEGIDPGFAYAPGSSLDNWPAPSGSAPIVTPPALQRTLAQSAQDVLRKSARLPAAAGADLLREIFVLQRAQDALDAGYAEFQAGAATATNTTADASYLVGMVDGELLQALASRGATPATAVVSIGAEQALASASAQLGAFSLPGALRSARAVLWDANAGELLFVVDGPRSLFRRGLLVTRVAVDGALCLVRGTERIGNAAGLARYELLRGSLD